MKKRDVPFQRHWLYYLILKYALIDREAELIGIRGKRLWFTSDWSR